LVPLLILLTGGIFGLALFWNDKLRIDIFYSKQKTLEESSHLIINGVPGNIEAVPLYSSVLGDDRKRSFIYRFIKFEFDSFKNQF
jgi:hypothetical protein